MVFLKSIFLVLVLAIAPRVLSQPETADLPTEIQIPIHQTLSVSTDGIFSPGEWVAAKEFKLKDNYSLYVMADSDYLYTALKFPAPMGECVAELRITPDKKRNYVLHVSGDLGEGVADFPDNPEFVVGIHDNWDSNPARIDSSGRQLWMDAGQPVERYDEMYIPREGIEFRISRDRLTGTVPRIQVSWIRVEVIGGEIQKKVYNYPLKAGLSNPEHWSRLRFSNGQELDEHLRPLEPLIHETWEAKEPRFGDGAIINRRFEIVENGKAIKRTDTFRVINATSEYFYYWDFEKKEIAVFGIHNNGNFVHGHLKEEDGKILIYGFETFPDKKLKFRNTFEFTEDGRYLDNYYRFEDNEWKPGHSWVFYQKKE